MTEEAVSEPMEEGEAETADGERVHEPDMEDTLSPFSPAHSPNFIWGEMEGGQGGRGY